MSLAPSGPPIRKRGGMPRAHSPHTQPTRADAAQNDGLADLHERLERATADLDPPFALVDLDALWANAADLRARAGTRPIRLASKSLRCRSLQERVLARDGFAGTLAFTLPEALWLEALLRGHPRRLSHGRPRRAAGAGPPAGRVAARADHDHGGQRRAA